LLIESANFCKKTLGVAAGLSRRRLRRLCVCGGAGNNSVSRNISSVIAEIIKHTRMLRETCNGYGERRIAMRLILNHTIYKIFIILLLPAVCSYCGEAPDEQGSGAFAAYWDITDVTNVEVAAIETLKVKMFHFVCGMLSTEGTFAGEDGKTVGITASFCERLSRLFWIQFTPVICGLDDLVAGLKSGERDVLLDWALRCGTLRYVAFRSREHPLHIGASCSRPF
jgi:hypothetical protein